MNELYKGLKILSKVLVPIIVVMWIINKLNLFPGVRSIFYIDLQIPVVLGNLGNLQVYVYIFLSFLIGLQLAIFAYDSRDLLGPFINRVRAKFKEWHNR